MFDAALLETLPPLYVGDRYITKRRTDGFHILMGMGLICSSRFSLPKFLHSPHFVSYIHFLQGPVTRDSIKVPALPCL